MQLSRNRALCVPISLCIVVCASASGCNKNAPAAGDQAAHADVSGAADSDTDADADMSAEAGDPSAKSKQAADEEFEFEDPLDEKQDSAQVQAVREAQKKVTEDMTAVRSKMDARRIEIDKKKAAIDGTKAELDKRLESITSLEKRLQELLGEGEIATRRRAERIGLLSKLMLSMPPQAAATMVAGLTDEDAQEIVLAMSRENERKASKLLSAMEAERASQLGQLYLDRDPKALTAGDKTPNPTQKAPSMPAKKTDPPPMSKKPADKKAPKL